MLKTILSTIAIATITTIATPFISNANANANDIYIPAISVADYQQALKNNENIVFKNAKLPTELRSIALKTFGNGIDSNSNEDQTISPQIILGTKSHSIRAYGRILRRYDVTKVLASIGSHFRDHRQCSNILLISVWDQLHARIDFPLCWIPFQPTLSVTCKTPCP